MQEDATHTIDHGPEQTGSGRRPSVVTLGFIPLTDCAVLAVARERGFAAAEGIELQLQREVSWANIRDKVALGHFQGAQMLAGMPIAASLGINQRAVPMLVPFCLNRNGNAITVSTALHQDLVAIGGLGGDESVAAAGAALRRVIAARRAAARPPLTFGMVFPFSCHNYELRYWLAACGIDPDSDVHLVVVPPPLMVDSLRNAQVDGFCVGEPWNSLAVEAGLGRIIVAKSELWRQGTEKVLGVPAAWAIDNANTLAGLIRALDRAAAWADDPANRAALAELLAAPAYLDMPATIVARALTGEMAIGPIDRRRTLADFLVLHRAGANLPSVDHALWIYSQMLRWGQVTRRQEDEAAIRATYRPDIYRAVMTGQPWTPQAPAADRAVDAPSFFDGRPFDPADIIAYLEA